MAKKKSREQITSITEGFPPLCEILQEKGISRRDFMKFCTAMSAALALPASSVPRIAHALDNVARPTLVWLEFQDCAGNTEALLRSSNPTVAELILDVLSIDYHETIMAAAGHQSEEALARVVKEQKGEYLAVVEGSIPLGADGAYCCIGGRSAVQIAREVCGNALATITVGSCAAFGGIPAADPNPTGAVGVKDAVPGATVINLPGCPLNPDNLTATVVHYLTYGKLPATDSLGRPLFAYGKRIHDACERRSHFDAGQYVEQWGDSAHRLGHCLYKMGCKGPETYNNCPTQRFNDKTSWPVGSGHGCVGCSQPLFWNTMTPFYRRLPNVPGFGIESTANKIGAGLALATAAAFAAHGVISAFRPGDDTEREREVEQNGENRNRPDHKD